jgi:dTDP-4-amino-4,6-dideoxygalactose transaminase
MYNNAFKDTRELIIQQEIPESETTRHLYVIRLNRKVFNAERSLVMTELGKLKVGTQVHYMPVYYHPYYEKLGYRKGLCPHAEALYEDILTIPLYFSMTDKDVEYVISSVKRVLKDLGTKK